MPRATRQLLSWMISMNWGKYYQRLRELATSYQLPRYEDGQVIDIDEIGRVSFEVQRVREWFVNAYAHAQQNLQWSRRGMIFAKYERKVKYNLHLATNEKVLDLKTREQRMAMANAICIDEDKRIADLESVISDWQAAVATIE